MLTIRTKRARRLLTLAIASVLSTACGGSDDPGTGPSDNNNQTASAVATPSSGTVARGGGATTTTTVVYSATGGLTIGSSFGIQRQFSGITVNQTSTQTVGSVITRVYTISADATIAPGAHEIRFSTPVVGYTGTSSAPTALAVFTLNVTN